MEPRTENQENQIAETSEKLTVARDTVVALHQQQQKHQPSGEVFSIQETAQILKVSAKSVYRLIERGLLKSNRALRHHRITRDSIDRFLKAV